MLKIKDNVDLKELEKYGFKYYEDENYYHNADFGELCNYDEIVIGDDNYEFKESIRVIQFGYEPCPDFIENYLYDMIKADLVEKVGE